MIIQELNTHDRHDWDQYVCHAVGGLPTHLSAWRDIMSSAYGYDTCFLMAKISLPDGGQRIAGILPLFFIQSVLTGNTATTMPGGLCADDTETADALIEAGRRAARAARAERLVLQDTAHEWPGSLETTHAHERWIVDIDGDEEQLWKGLHRNIRRQIRLARGNDLTVVIDRTGDAVDDFFHVLSRFTHQAGTPVFPRGFLIQVIRHLPDSFNMVIVYKEQEPIAGYFQLAMGNTSYGMWGAALREHLALRPVYLAYWTILADACTAGQQFVDMGRSPTGSNASHFKSQWGGECTPIYQQVASLDGQHAAASVTVRVQQDGRFRSFRQIWPRIPFPVAQFLGPKLRRHVPFA